MLQTKNTKNFISYSVTGILERVLVTLVCMISSVFMGHLGAAELSSVSVSNTIVDIVQSMFIGLGTGATVFVSQAFAKGETEEIEHGCFQHLVISVLLSLVVFFVFQFWTEEIVNLLFRNTTDTVRTMTKTYLGCVKWVFPVIAIDHGLTACFRGVKNAKLPFVFALGMNVLNVLLCVLFIFKLHMGYLGGAYAYIFSIAASCVLKLILVILPVTDVRIKRFYALDFKRIKSIIKIGLPMLIEYLFIKTGFLGMQMITALLGTITLASYQVINSVYNLLYAITGGLETVQITYVSSYVALNQKKEAEKTVFGVLKFAEIFLLSLGVLILVFSTQIASVFTKDAEVIKQASLFLRVMLVTLPFTTYFQSVQAVMKICKDVKIVIIMTVVATWLLRVPVAYFFVKIMGLDFYGLVIGFMADYVVRSVVFGVVIRKRNWLEV